MLDKLTKETFEPIMGGVSLGEGQTLPLELSAVLGTGLQGMAKREQFSLHFRGPASPSLMQRTYHLENAQLGPLEIFLVPIRRDATGMIYEAVFT
jgi:hypothetical protein